MPKTLFAPILLLLPVLALADAFVIDPDESVFAIATQRGGIAGRMAHDHLVHAGHYDYELTVEGDALEQSAFSLTLAAEELVADEAEALERWWPRIRELGLVPRGASSFSEGERTDIREAMLGEDQLDADNHPEITAELLEIVESSNGDATHSARVAMTVVGETVEYDFDADISLEGDTLTVEAYTTAKFTDFGIPPYRAFLGAVRNQDEFVVFVSFRAERE